MPNTPPRHLRIHIETEDTAQEGEIPSLTWDQVQADFALATGYNPEPMQSAQTAQRSLGVTACPVHLRPVGDPDRRVNDTAVYPLAGTLHRLWQQKEDLTRALRNSEAELATAIPLVSHPGDAFCGQLEGILRGAVQLTRSTAAGIFLLDDATTELKMRACWGMDPTRLSDPPRALRHAIADLEALTGHAVVLEDTGRLAHWSAPFSYPSAACVPIQSDSMALGTLWVFREEPSDFTDQDTHILEMVATCVSSELERHVLLREAGQKRPFPIANRCVWVPPEIAGWQIAASAVDPIPQGFCFWHLRRDDRILLAVGESIHSPEQADRLKLMLRTAADSYGDPAQLLSHLNDCLWIEEGGRLLASVFLAILEKETGRMNYANLGDSCALHRHDETWTAYGQKARFWGESDESNPPSGSGEIVRGEDLILLQPGGRPDTIRPTLAAVAEIVAQAPRMRAQGLADRIARSKAAGKRPRSVITVRRT